MCCGYDAGGYNRDNSHTQQVTIDPETYSKIRNFMERFTREFAGVHLKHPLKVYHQTYTHILCDTLKRITSNDQQLAPSRHMYNLMSQYSM